MTEEEKKNFDLIIEKLKRDKFVFVDYSPVDVKVFIKKLKAYPGLEISYEHMRNGYKIFLPNSEEDKKA